MTTRSNLQVLATILVGTTAVGALLLTGLLVAVAAGAVGLLGPGMNAFGWIVAAASGSFGVAGLIAAVGLWRGRAWAPVVAGVVQLIGTLGAIVAVATSGPQAPTLVGLALVAGGLAAVVADLRSTEGAIAA
ncbi:MAG: hypothetical protein ACSLFN_04685 [Candidatus Limnocylindrales bacterium]